MFAWDLHHFADILEYNATIYEINSNQNAHDYLLCTKFANYSKFIVKMLPISYVLTYILFGCASLYESLTTERLMAPFYLYLPDIYDDATPDIPLCVVNIVFMAIALITISTFDTMILITFCNVSLLAAIIERELYEFKSSLKNGHLPRTEIRLRLLKIICMQKKYKEIILKLNQGFGYVSAIQITTACLVTSVAILIAIKVCQ